MIRAIRVVTYRYLSLIRQQGNVLHTVKVPHAIVCVLMYSAITMKLLIDQRVFQTVACKTANAFQPQQLIQLL